jgi:hypothetical protein
LKLAVEPSYQERYLRRDEVHRVRHHEALYDSERLSATATVQRRRLDVQAIVLTLACWRWVKRKIAVLVFHTRSVLVRPIPSTYLADVAVVKRFCHVSRQLRICQEGRLGGR